MARDPIPGRAPLVSVITLTRDRPAHFARLLGALRRQRFTDFEVIAVGRLTTAEAHGAAPDLARRLTWLTCAAENVSRSRNTGLAAASGAIVAFTDDDAAPEPDWLTHLIRPFAAEDVGAVGGHVRGRNGVDFQWRGAVVDRYGFHRPLAATDLLTADYSDPAAPEALTVMGVNCAFRRVALTGIGGFDERFRYYLDESDACLRLRADGWRTVFAPAAEVHHAFAESVHRAPNRAPRDLTEVAASRACFAATHGDPAHLTAMTERWEAAQQASLRRQMRHGRLSRRQMLALADRLRAGVALGEARAAEGPALAAFPAPPASAARYGAGPRLRVAIAPAVPHRRAALRLAERLAATCDVSLLDFRLSARPLKIRFDGAMWRHEGGVLGRESFDSPHPGLSRPARIRRELARIAAHRAPEALIRPGADRYRLGDGETLPLGAYVIESLRPGAAAELAARLPSAGAPAANAVIMPST